MKIVLFLNLVIIKGLNHEGSKNHKSVDMIRKDYKILQPEDLSLEKIK